MDFKQRDGRHFKEEDWKLLILDAERKDIIEIVLRRNDILH